MYTYVFLVQGYLSYSECKIKSFFQIYIYIFLVIVVFIFQFRLKLHGYYYLLVGRFSVFFETLSLKGASCLFCRFEEKFVPKSWSSKRDSMLRFELQENTHAEVRFQ